MRAGFPPHGIRLLVPLSTMGFALALFMTALAPAATARASTTWNVSISSYQFTPSTVTISVGDTVTWTVGDGTHTTTSDPGQTESWNSGPMSAGQSFSYTFNAAGNYTYHCAIHAIMHGEVIVQQPTPEFPGIVAFATVGFAAALGLALERKLRR